MLVGEVWTMTQHLCDKLGLRFQFLKSCLMVHNSQCLGCRKI